MVGLGLNLALTSLHSITSRFPGYKCSYIGEASFFMIGLAWFDETFLKICLNKEICIIILTSFCPPRSKHWSCPIDGWIETKFSTSVFSFDHVMFSLLQIQLYRRNSPWFDQNGIIWRNLFKIYLNKEIYITLLILFFLLDQRGKHCSCSIDGWIETRFNTSASSFD